MRIISSNLPGRVELIWLLDQAGLNSRGDIAVEVGVHRGDFAEELLSRTPRAFLGDYHCVDPWVDTLEGCNHTYWGGATSRQEDFEYCQHRLRRYGDRVHYHKQYSHDAVKEFEDNSLSLVYLDGNHHLPYISFDLGAWWPKIKPGGFLAGHDIVNAAPIEDNCVDVLNACMAFSDTHRVWLWLIPQLNPLGNWSFYFRKPTNAT